MARATMSWIITHLRRKVNDVDSEIWTDDQLQIYLDSHRKVIIREELKSDKDKYNFYSEFGFLEGIELVWSGSGDPSTDVINIWDDSDEDSIVKTPDSFNLVNGSFTFSTEQDDAPYFLDAYSYDINLAIAECFEELIGDPDRAASWSSRSITLKNYDLFQLAKYFRERPSKKARLIK